MTWRSILWFFGCVFLLASAGILTLFVLRVGNSEVIAELAAGIIFMNDTEITIAAYYLLYGTMIGALIMSVPLTVLYALVVCIVKFTKWYRK